jgi:hypothetical protein
MEYSVLDVAANTDHLQGALAASLDTSSQVTGIVASTDTVANRLLVSVRGSDPIPMPYAAGTYTNGEMVDVSLEYVGGVINPYVRGRTGGTPGGALPTVPPSAPTTDEATALILPEWTGTWDTNSSRYDNHNVGRTAYGGRATLYQGDKYGSGPLVGLATYGEQIVALDAVSIESIVVTLRGAGLAEATYPAIELQAATNAAPSSAPSLAGTAVTGSPGKSGVVNTALHPSVLEGFRIGTYKGVGLAGTGSAEYAAVRGTSDADGMALTVNYTRLV